MNRHESQTASAGPPRRWWAGLISLAILYAGWSIPSDGNLDHGLGAMMVLAAGLSGLTCEFFTGWKNLPLISVSLMILFGGVFGFGNKLVALIRFAASTTEGEEARFAIAPVVNYLLASAGFFLMVLWGASHGMFQDIEKPKFDMLETDERLNALRHEEHYSDSILFGAAKS